MEATKRNWSVVAVLAALVCALALALASAVPAAYAEDDDTISYTTVSESESTSVTLAAASSSSSYSVSYFKFTPASTATYKISFTGDDLATYGDDLWIEGLFDSSDVEVDGASYSYSSSECYAAGALTAGETYYIVVCNYNEADVTLSVSAATCKSIDDATVSLDPSSYEITDGVIDIQTAILPNLIVTYDGTTLAYGTDYVVYWDTADTISAPGTYYLYLEGMGDYIGYTETSFTVTVATSATTALTADGGAKSTTLSEGESAYYSFTPSTSGFYTVSGSAFTYFYADIFDSAWSYYSGFSADDGNSGEEIIYFAAGETYYIVLETFAPDDSAASGTVSAAVSSATVSIVEITQLDTPYTVTASESGGTVYVALEPTVSGTYTITIAYGSDVYFGWDVFDETGAWMDYGDYDVTYSEDDTYLTISIDLTAGTVYYLPLYLYAEDGASPSVTVTVSSDVAGAGLASTGVATTTAATTTSSSSTTTSTTSSSDSLAATGDNTVFVVAALALAGAAACIAGLARSKRRAL